MTMQVQIEHSGGGDISLEDCASFTGPLNDAIEASNIVINKGYVLEISSAGLSEQLITDRDFQTFRGFPVEVIYKDKSNCEHRVSKL